MMELPKEPGFYPDESKIHKIMKTNLSDGEIDIRLKYPDAEQTHIMVFYIQEAIRKILHDYDGYKPDDREGMFEKYSKPICMKLVKICKEQLNQLEEKDRFFPNFIASEEDMRRWIRLEKGSL